MKKKILIAVASVICIGAVITSVVVTKDKEATENVNYSSLPQKEMMADYAIDPNNKEEMTKDVDYIFVAKVIKNKGTHYEDTVQMEDENGGFKEVGSPYTDYEIQVVENIKGELSTDQAITIKKQGGIAEEKDCIWVYEGDKLPEENKEYLFMSYTQEDGSLLVSGMNSNIELNDNNSQDTIKEYKKMTKKNSNVQKQGHYKSKYDKKKN